DRVLPAAELLAQADGLVGLPLDAVRSRDALCNLVEGVGAGRTGVPAALDHVLRMVADSPVTRVDELAERCGCSVRALQRLVRRYVGVGPKWLIRRQRIHEAVAELDAGPVQSLAQMAVRLGWYDQSQFARDFTSLVGVSPTTYRNR
ncbi:MAG: helix-turn-helix transcriptional regulator, partial [Luteimonas sp.]|nr:helix-turn-helix transcriptional regulator [Luteimonas sp.]